MLPQPFTLQCRELFGAGMKWLDALSWSRGMDFARGWPCQFLFCSTPVRAQPVWLFHYAQRNFGYTWYNLWWSIAPYPSGFVGYNSVSRSRPSGHPCDPKTQANSWNGGNMVRTLKNNYTGKRPQTVCRRTATKDPWHQPTSASQYEAPRQIAGKLFTRHMFVSSVHFVSQDPLQESCLRFMS